MSEAVQQGAGESFRAEDLGPLVEGQVGGDQDRTSLVSLAEDLEEEFRAGLGEWDEAQLVDDEQLESGQLLLEVQQSSFVPSLDQLMDQRGGRGEADRQPPLAGCEPQAEGNMGLAGLTVPLLAVQRSGGASRTLLNQSSRCNSEFLPARLSTTARTGDCIAPAAQWSCRRKDCGSCHLPKAACGDWNGITGEMQKGRLHEGSLPGRNVL